MLPYTEEDLKELALYIRSEVEALEKKEDPTGNVSKLLNQVMPEGPKSASEELMAVARQIEALGYSPMLIESLLEEYEVPYDLMSAPLENLPQLL